MCAVESKIFDDRAFWMLRGFFELHQPRPFALAADLIMPGDGERWGQVDLSRNERYGGGGPRVAASEIVEI